MERSFLVEHSLEPNCELAVGVCKSHFDDIKMQSSVLTYDGAIETRGRHIVCSSQILVVAAQFRSMWMQEFHGEKKSNQLIIANVHFHYATSKKISRPNAAEAYNNFFDELAEAIFKFGVNILCGDFNVALFAVIPELPAFNMALFEVKKKPN